MIEIMIIAVCLFVFLTGIAAFGGNGGGSWCASKESIDFTTALMKRAGDDYEIFYRALREAPDTKNGLEQYVDKLVAEKAIMTQTEQGKQG